MPAEYLMGKALAKAIVDEETGEATVSKTSGEKISMKLGIGSQEKIGVNKNNLSKLLDNDSDTVNNEFKTTMSKIIANILRPDNGCYNYYSKVKAC